MVDHEYMTMHGQNIRAHFEKILSDIIRENLKNGGINVRYFSWNSVRLKKGKILIKYLERLVLDSYGEQIFWLLSR